MSGEQIPTANETVKAEHETPCKSRLQRIWRRIADGVLRLTLNDECYECEGARQTHEHIAKKQELVTPANSEARPSKATSELTAGSKTSVETPQRERRIRQVSKLVSVLEVLDEEGAVVYRVGLRNKPPVSIETLDALAALRDTRSQ